MCRGIFLPDLEQQPIVFYFFIKGTHRMGLTNFNSLLLFARYLFYTEVEFYVQFL